jgi:hypothetical protein
VELLLLVDAAMIFCFSSRFREKTVSNLNVKNIMDNLGKNRVSFLHAKRVADTLTNFISSCDNCISSEHVPYRDITTKDSEGDRNELEFVNSEQYIKVIRAASKHNE